jgi:regulator of nucleoside diphosphate kinase
LKTHFANEARRKVRQRPHLSWIEEFDMINRTNMTEKPPVITEVDFDRLNHLASSRDYRFSHGSLLTSLKRELERGKVVPPTRVPPGVVTMNSCVRLHDVLSEERETYTLVYPAEANIDEGKLSVLAPLGTALLGSKVGRIIEVKTPGGLRRLKVDKVLYQPESVGDFHL